MRYVAGLSAAMVVSSEAVDKWTYNLDHRKSESDGFESIQPATPIAKSSGMVP